MRTTITAKHHFAVWKKRCATAAPSTEFQPRRSKTRPPRIAAAPTQNAVTIQVFGACDVDVAGAVTEQILPDRLTRRRAVELRGVGGLWQCFEFCKTSSRPVPTKDAVHSAEPLASAWLRCWTQWRSTSRPIAWSAPWVRA